MDNIIKCLKKLKKLLKKALIIDDEECFNDLEDVIHRTRVAEHAYVNAKRDLDSVKAGVKTNLVMKYENVRETIEEASKKIAEKKQENLDILDKNSDQFSEKDAEKDLNNLIEEAIDSLKELKKEPEESEEDKVSWNSVLLYLLYAIFAVVSFFVFTSKIVLIQVLFLIIIMIIGTGIQESQDKLKDDIKKIKETLEDLTALNHINKE